VDASERNRPLSAQLNRLWATVRLLRQRFGETVIQLASAVGPPAPIPIQVGVQPDGMPAWLGWGGWPRPGRGRSHRVASVYEHWRVYDRWWEQPVQRDYYQVETDGQALFTVFRDEQGRWFLVPTGSGLAPTGSACPPGPTAGAGGPGGLERRRGWG
jgi:hypothetical protein